jgi:hypothetical protein
VPGRLLPRDRPRAPEGRAAACAAGRVGPAVRKITRASRASAVRSISRHSAVIWSAFIQSCASSSTKRCIDCAGWALEEIGQRGVVDLDLVRPCTDDSRRSRAQIGGHRLAVLDVVAAAEGLPGEVVLADRKIAGQPLDALAQHAMGSPFSERNELVILRRRNAQRVERDRRFRQQLDRFVVEKRRDMRSNSRRCSSGVRAARMSSSFLPCSLATACRMPMKRPSRP